MLNWKKIIVSMLLLCAVPGYLCAGTNDKEVFNRVVNYLEKGQVRQLKTYWDSLLPAYNGRNPYHVLDKALTQRYTKRFGKKPFEFNPENYKRFYKTYKGTWLQSEVENVMMGIDSNGWLNNYFHSDGSKYLDMGGGLYIRAYLKKYLGIDTKGMLMEHAARYPNLVYFDLAAWQIKAILLGAEEMAAGVGDRGLYLQVKQNILFNYLDYDTYKQEGLTKEFVHTMELLGATNDNVWWVLKIAEDEAQRVLKIKPITEKMQENAVKLYSKCHGTVGLNKKLCENFQKHAKKHKVWMKISVPPLPTPERRTTSIL